MKKFLITAVLICLMANVIYADFYADVKKDTAILAESSDRTAGSKGSLAAYKWLSTELEKLKSLKVITQQFPVIMPHLKQADVTIDNGAYAGKYRIYPIWPSNVRLNTTPDGGISGNFVYVDDAEYKDLPTHSLKGNIAVMEMSAYHKVNWLRVFDLGARALILLGGEHDTVTLPNDQPIYKPRFFIPAGKLANALRQNKSLKGTIKVTASFEHKTARNICVAVKGKRAASEMKPLVVAVQYDAMSIVQGLAPGADSALDAAFLLNMARYFSKNKPERSLLLVFVDAYAVNQLGVRRFLSLLKSGPNDMTRRAYEKQTLDEIEEYRGIVDVLDALNKKKAPLQELCKKSSYKNIQRMLKDVLSPEIVRLKEETGDLRLAVSKAEGKNYKVLKQELDNKSKRLIELNQFLFQAIIKGDISPQYADLGAQCWDSVCQRATLQLRNMEKRLAFFKEQDRLRGEINEALGVKEGTDPYTFMMGLDLSDCGINIGPSLICGYSHVDYIGEAREFTRWLKAKLRVEDGVFSMISPGKLTQLGIKAESAGTLLKNILNMEAVEEIKLYDTFANSLSGVEKARINDIVKRIEKEKPDKAKLLDMLQASFPELSAEKTESLLETILNQQAVEGGMDAKSFAPEQIALLTAPARGFNMRSVFWSTLEGVRERLDTPRDTIENIRWDRVKPQIFITAMLLEVVANDDSFDVASPSVTGFPKWRMPHGSIVSESVSETIPRTPAAGMLVTLISSNNWIPLSCSKGVRGMEYHYTGPDGSFLFTPIQVPKHYWLGVWKVRAFNLNDFGEITKGISESGSLTASVLSTSVNLSKNPPLNPIRAVTFDCVEFNPPTFFDPRYQTPLSGASLIDVIRGGKPKYYQLYSFNGQVWGLLKPDTIWQLIMRIGNTGARQALMNIPHDLVKKKMSLRQALSQGYKVDEPITDLPALISAKDFYEVDDWRIDLLDQSGVSTKAINKLHADTAQYISKAEEALKNDDGAALYRNANAALSNEIRVYQALMALVEDVTRGAIFLLMLLVPFSVVAERLVVASVSIGRQILYSIIIFILMSAVLWSFHPGFKITSQPLIILMAFAVLILSTAVIIMILRKSKSDLAELRSGSLAEASGAQTGRGGVIGSAVWLGIANMRKRLVRTFLTGTTIVLITFSLLCFTSSSTFQDMRKVSLSGIMPNYSGIMLQHPAKLGLDNQLIENISNLLEYKYPVIGRYWGERNGWPLHVRNPKDNALASFKGGLFLSPGEENVSNIDDILPDWQTFTKSGKGCYISAANAGELGVKAGDTVVAGGIPLTLVGVFDSVTLEKKLRKLDGDSLLPIDYSIEQQDGSLNQIAIESMLASGGLLANQDNVSVLSGDDVIILPAGMVGKLSTSLRNIAIQTPPEETEKIAKKLMRSQVYPVYYSDGDAVRVLVSTPLIPSAPRKILIPIIIAALIIFNTMLNSIAERKKEIRIYSSLGLAPPHIGVLFLAEALTYGLIGSVFGYIFGQGVATILTYFDLMGGITLNYSGSNVIMTMGLVLAIVTLSSLVPAYMAIKVASPSKDADWKVPQPVDGVIKDKLPFTVSTHVARGLVAFIYDYVDAHRDGAIGNFTSDNLQYHKMDDGDKIAALTGTVWLAPYDLGVRQDFCIEVVHDIENICNINISLTYRAGQERSWWKLNRIFLGDLRRQLLGWRNIPQERVIRYIEEAGTRFCQQED